MYYTLNDASLLNMARVGRARARLNLGKPAEAAHRPFCSDRCRLLDLGKWLGEEYRVPAGRPGDGAVVSLANPDEDS